MLKKKEQQVVSSPPKDLYFMKSISNGTAAMMHAVANNRLKYDLKLVKGPLWEPIFKFLVS